MPGRTSFEMLELIDSNMIANLCSIRNITIKLIKCVVFTI